MVNIVNSLLASALQCPNRTKKRHLPNHYKHNLFCLLCDDAAAYADHDIWYNDNSFLYPLHYDRKHFSLSSCPEDIQT